MHPSFDTGLQGQAGMVLLPCKAFGIALLLVFWDPIFSFF